MSDPRTALTHLTVVGRAENRDFRRRGGGDARIRDVERRPHGGKLRGDLRTSFTKAERDRKHASEELALEELKALGVILVLDAADRAFPLKLDSLERMSGHRGPKKRPLWLLLSVIPASDGQPESAVVWVSDEFRAKFLKIFEDFLTRQTTAGSPRNRELVANIGRIRSVVLRDLWQSAGAPPAGLNWWELWLTPSPTGLDLLRTFAGALRLRLASRTLEMTDRTVTWIEARWDDLHSLPFTAVPIAEIRRPEIVDTIDDLPREDQYELTSDLMDRTAIAIDENAPAVCHLDSGVRRSHLLLSASLDAGDVHSVVDSAGTDTDGHGTSMAGLALYGPLDDLLVSTKPIALTHRLESVKILPDSLVGNDPLTYGLVTAQAGAAVETSAAGRPRVFCLPVTAQPEARPGEPSLWSASIDALSAGTDIGRSENGITLIGRPAPEASRLFVISAGNVRQFENGTDYLDLCDTAAIEDPAQAWNALVVGAYTELTASPSDPGFADWTPLAADGALSPHSRTSLLFGTRPWPIKPDICLEGGNVLTDGVDFHDKHPLHTVRTTSHKDDLTLTSANATSAATAQASRLAAKAMAAYPSYWPESVRGLLVHTAEWTPAMRADIDGEHGKAARQAMLRRYGWGVPAERTLLTSSRNAVTLVTQDEFVPFTGSDHQARNFRLHRLPWPRETLRSLLDTHVQLRITLSYFIEPAASRRGWRRRYSYASHGLRFELRSPLEQRLEDFVARVNRDAGDEETGGRPSGGSERWLVGSNQRNLGSLHHDIWDGTGAELADSDLVAVYPVGGWWKANKRADRADLPLRYSLIVSLRTPLQDVDLYTPIATELTTPIAVEIEEA
ncbi:Subtilase family protein [Amycolatopsis lurida]|uniref:Subtilisin family serine protease n=1 Tax=Amycolatopsis lurida NRRL 2430 TaxID=1460371 RepID=A0A2P2FP02_AMYLU|nr:S8 family peptidase [Amycolatopsis lurida]KFU78454.1 subtilisin family serine protease [Amycolatopsis lurida NRRL 2430]SEE26457.1 Subtilase family protein [Amycolatopsis lurida]